MHHHFSEAGVLVDELGVGPVLTAVGGLVEAAFLVRAEEVSDRGDIDRVRILRVHHHARDALRLLQADVLELLAAVGGLVDAAAEGRALPVVRLTGAHVDGVRV